METTPTTINHEIIESLIINGDLSKLQPKQKIEYYTNYCTALGLNPITQPFALLKLNGKEKLYCGREGVAQLSKVHSVSHEILSSETINGVFIVKAKATAGTRFTTSTGAVSIEGLKGDALCNALMKAETKAKRRATLDLLGLGVLDDVEIETIPGAKTDVIDITLSSKITERCNLLKSATTLEDLKIFWESLGSEMQKVPEIMECKEACKESLSQPV